MTRTPVMALVSILGFFDDGGAGVVGVGVTGATSGGAVGFGFARGASSNAVISREETRGVERR